jgi:cytochrome o ubiquinol oxidase operon protein cyoD
MSANHSHAADHGENPLRSHVIGFAISLALTFFSFGLVMSGVLASSATLIVVVIAAALQVFAQFHYFLHLDSSSKQRMNVMVLIYTIVIIAILVGLSLWIMYNTHIRMMPIPMAR